MWVWTASLPASTSISTTLLYREGSISTLLVYPHPPPNPHSPLKHVYPNYHPSKSRISYMPSLPLPHRSHSSRFSLSSSVQCTTSRVPSHHPTQPDPTAGIRESHRPCNVLPTPHLASHLACLALGSRGRVVEYGSVPSIQPARARACHPQHVRALRVAVWEFSSRLHCTAESSSAWVSRGYRRLESREVLLCSVVCRDVLEECA